MRVELFYFGIGARGVILELWSAFWERNGLDLNRRNRGFLRGSYSLCSGTCDIFGFDLVSLRAKYTTKIEGETAKCDKQNRQWQDPRRTLFRLRRLLPVLHNSITPKDVTKPHLHSQWNKVYNQIKTKLPNTQQINWTKDSYHTNSLWNNKNMPLLWKWKPNRRLEQLDQQLKFGSLTNTMHKI